MELEITAEKIAELKKKYGDIYQADISFVDENDKKIEVSVIHKKPDVDDFETFQKESANSVSTAYRNLFHNTVVYPEKKNEIYDLVGESRPGFYLQFAESLSPFLSLKTKVERKKL